jgi:hypothetical protein
MGGSYDPFNNQIVFVPFDQAQQTKWHRYDCATQTIEIYPNPFHSTSTPQEHRSVWRGYMGGVYDPLRNQIVFVPNKQAQQTAWHHYDCPTRTIEAYESPFDSNSTPVDHQVVDQAYYGGIYDPFNNQIVFIPANQANRRNWHVIQNYGKPQLSRQFAAHYLFNKF